VFIEQAVLEINSLAIDYNGRSLLIADKGEGV